MGDIQPNSKSATMARFSERVLIRCPASLPPAIDRAAAKNLMTASEYIRRSVIERLKKDGIDLSELNQTMRQPGNGYSRAKPANRKNQIRD